MKGGKKSFIREVKQEYKNVNWPSKDQVLSSTGVVLFFVFVMSIFLGLVDYGILNLIHLILGIG
jgi:preprotein translocase subunit SecE